MPGVRKGNCVLSNAISSMPKSSSAPPQIGTASSSREEPSVDTQLLTDFQYLRAVNKTLIQHHAEYLFLAIFFTKCLAPTSGNEHRQFETLDD